MEAPSKLADTLSHLKEEILSIWEQKVRETVYAARKETQLSLRNSIPEFLDYLIQALKLGMKDVRSDLIKFAHHYGAERAQESEFSIEDALAEHNILRKVIFTVLETKSEITSHERDIIFEAINLGLAKAGAEYTKLQVRELETSRSQLYGFFMQCPAPMVIITCPELRFALANPPYEKLVGRKVIGKTLYEVFTDEAALENAKIIQQVYLTGEPYFLKEFAITLPDETQGTQEYFLNVSYTALRDNQGKINAVTALIFDVTEEVQARQTIKKSEENFRLLADALPQIIWMAAPDGHVYWYNKGYWEYTGLNEGTNWDDQGISPIHPDDMPHLVERWTSSLKTGEPTHIHFRIKNTKGQYRWHLSRGVPVRNDEGQIIRWVGSNTDIHDQKMLQRDLEEETVLREKFVSTLSHDLRTPLTAAKISAQFIGKKTDDEKLRSMAVRINDNLDRADSMIKDLLDASKIRAGKSIQPNIQEIDVVEVAQQAIENLSTIHGDRFLLKSPTHLKAYLSPDGLTRVIENLCGNAIKYGSAYDPVHVLIEPGKKNLSLCVRNNGNPLINVNKEKLFEPFVQGSAKKTAGVRGWGIGLTIVKGVTEAHGGEVNVDSNDEGTTFKIKLPLDARTFSGLIQDRESRGYS